MSQRHRKLTALSERLTPYAGPLVLVFVALLFLGGAGNNIYNYLQWPAPTGEPAAQNLVWFLIYSLVGICFLLAAAAWARVISVKKDPRFDR